MELDSSLEPTSHYRWIELGVAARKMIEEVFPIKPGQQVLVIADTLSDWPATPSSNSKAAMSSAATPGKRPSKLAFASSACLAASMRWFLWCNTLIILLWFAWSRSSSN